MHTGWKKIIALHPLQWKEKVCLIAISKISQSSGLSPRKMGGIGSRTDPCFGSDIIYTYQFYLIELLKNIVENVNKKERNKKRDSRFRIKKIQHSMGYCYYQRSVEEVHSSIDATKIASRRNAFSHAPVLLLGSFYHAVCYLA